MDLNRMLPFVGNVIIRLILPEFFVRLRGVDKWPNTTATVTVFELVTTPRAGNWNNFSFYYRLDGSEIQSGSLKADSLTSICSLGVGDGL